MKTMKCKKLSLPAVAGVKRIKIFFVLLMLFFTLYSSHFTLHAVDKGTSGGQFLKIGVGARAVAMGEAYAGMEGDINSIYWNPAGLSKINNLQASFSHTAWFQDINYENLMAGYPFNFGFMALGINYLAAGKIDKYDKLGEPAGESYEPTDMSVTFAYSKKIKNISLGTNLKYISSNIDSENAAAWGCDFGGMCKINKLNIGLAVQNLGTKMEFIKDAYSLPLNVKLGGSYKIRRCFTAALDFNFPNDNDFRVNTGFEYSRRFADELTASLRTGYKTNTEGLKKINGFSAGFGLKYKEYRMDYAWVPYGVLGKTHRISVTYKGKEVALAEKKPKKAKKISPTPFIKGEEKKHLEEPLEKVENIDEEIRRLEQELFRQEETSREKKKERVLPLENAGKKALMKSHFSRATQLYRQKKYADAIAEWKEVLKLDPDHQLSKQKIKRAKEKLKLKEQKYYEKSAD